MNKPARAFFLPPLVDASVRFLQDLRLLDGAPSSGIGHLFVARGDMKRCGATGRGRSDRATTPVPGS